MRDTVKLIMVTDQNNNKFYNMVDNGNGTMTVTYGRVGTPGVSKDYDIYEWDRIYNQKTGKGYKDVTNLYRQQQSSSKGYKPMDDSEIEALINKLQSKSRQFTGTFYDDSVVITKEMLAEAQDLLNDAALYVTKADSYTTRIFNEHLLKIFSVLPRKMTNVRDELCQTDNPKERQQILQREQDLIDNMKSQVVVSNTIQTVDDKTICDALGIVVSKCNDKDIELITDNLKDLDSRYKMNNAWIVRNNARDKGFNDYLENNNLKNNKKNVKTYWHGTGTENVFSIMTTALQLNPTNAYITGKMFGNGIYSAPKASKSLGYTSLSGSYWKGGHDNVGYMFLNAVITGNTLDVYNNNEIHNGIRIYNLDGDTFSSKLSEYHSVYAHASSGVLRNDEVIVYNQNQIASRYLVEIAYK